MSDGGGSPELRRSSKAPERRPNVLLHSEWSTVIGQRRRNGSSRETCRCEPHLHTSVAMMTHQAVQQQSALGCWECEWECEESSLLRRRQQSQKE